MRHNLLRVAAMALAILAPVAALAMSVSPMHIEMKSVGGTGRSQFTVTNSSTEPLPVETRVRRVELDEAGGMQTAEAGQDFLVFPVQAIIPPGASQVFRLQWVGEPNIATSQTYLLSVAQVPVKMAKAKSGIEIAMSFGVVVDVAPPQGDSALKLLSSSITTDKHGKHFLAITVENPGTVHAMLENASLSLAADGWSKTYNPSDIQQGIGIGLVQPGKRRRFVLPDALPASVSSVTVHLDYAQGH